MTKKQEEALFNKVDKLEQLVHNLLAKAENNQLDKHIYSVPEVAQILGRTPQAIYAMIGRGELETIKLGKIKVLGESLRMKLKGEC